MSAANRTGAFPFQTVGSGRPADRTDHVWFFAATAWKCCLCGAVEAVPPPYPTPKTYVPSQFALPVTAEELALCPRDGKGGAS